MAMNEILREFLLETHENLASLDGDLVTLEKKPDDKSTLAQVFRTLHSVKGTAGFIGLVKLQSVSHAAENLLSRLRAGEIRFNRPIATATLKVVDAIREMLASIETSGEEGSGDYSTLIAELDRLRLTGGAESAPAETPPPTTVVPPSVAKAQTIEIAGAKVSAATTDFFPDAPLPESPASVSPLFPIPPTAAQPPIAPSPPAPAPVAPPTTPLPFETFVGGAPLRTVSTVEQPVAPMAPAPTPSGPTVDVAVASPEASEPKSASVADTSIRVDVRLLDKLMNLVGELVLARNQIVQHSSSYEDVVFLNTVQRLNLLTTELQTSVMKTRMQPIGNVWSKFPRVVRDLALACGKKVRFEMDGQETELDKTLIEAIRDPLTHMVRNAVDHGIEPPDARVARGKPAEGRLHMHAYHEGGKVVVEIADDGGGIDATRVRDKAVQAKLVTAQDAARMTRADILQLIFLPGFSTADKVTQFSGRGVGMDVVRTNIERIGGSVEVESVEGQGTTIRTKIPLTLAIVPALICSTAGERFAVPQASLLEVVRLEANQGARGVEWMHGAPVHRLRGRLLPLVFLDEQLRLESQRDANQEFHIVVLQAEDQNFGLVVDGIRDTEEIVVKPLQKQLKGISVFAGAAIMGDGRVALILDVMGIAHRAGLLSASRERQIGERERERSSESTAADGESLLLFAPKGGGSMAIPMSLVSRLEELPRSSLEQVGDRHVAQYRGEILPLIEVTHAMERLVDASRRRDAPPLDGETVSVVVCEQDQGGVGLIVERIVDVVHETILARTAASRPGVRFAAVVQGKVTEFVDVAALAGALDARVSPAETPSV